MARYVVAEASDIPEGSQKLVTVQNRDICIFNVNGEHFALLNRCPHEGGSLCHGYRVGFVTSPRPGVYEFSRPGEMVKCAWHGWEFDIRTGQSWCDPRKYRARPYKVTVEAGEELAGLVKGPYVAESFPVTREGNYLVLEL